jgi:homoserine kinase
MEFNFLEVESRVEAMVRLARGHPKLVHAQMEFHHAKKKRAADTASSGAGPSVIVMKSKSSFSLYSDFWDGIINDDTAAK